MGAAVMRTEQWGDGPEGARENADEQVVAFRLAAESYGVNIGQVREIVTLPPITHVPGAPHFVEGVINLRGQVIPVVDLRQRFGMPPAERGSETRVMVAEVGEFIIGLIVDGVSEVLTVSGEQVEPPSPAIVGPKSLFIRGVARLGDRLLVLLGLEHLLGSDELASTEKAMADGGAEAAHGVPAERQLAPAVGGGAR